MAKKIYNAQDFPHLIADFQAYLAAQNLTETTIEKHFLNISTFWETFFVQYADTIEEFSDAAILEFLGDFYIRKFLFSNKRDIQPFLTTFKKFAAFCLEHEQIDEETYKDIIDICKKKDFFTHRFDTYMKTDDVFEWTFDNDPDLYEAEKREEQEHLLTTPIKRNDKLISVLEKHTGQAVSIIPIFRHVLGQIQTTSPFKTTTRGHFPRSFWLEVDDAFTLQLFRKPSLNQEDIPLYQFLYQVLIHTGAIQVEKQKASPTSHLTDLLNLSDVALWSLLLDHAWSHISWSKLQPEKIGGRPEVSHVSRATYARILSQFPVDTPLKRPDPLLNELIFEAFNATTDVFFLFVLPILEYCGLAKITLLYDEQKSAYHRSYSLHTLAITEIGCSVFTHWTSHDQPQFTEEELYNLDPLSQLLMQDSLKQTPVTVEKIGRNEPCPCGSGKKHKKCCLK